VAVRNTWAVTDTGGVLGVEDGRLALGALVTSGTAAYKSKIGFRPAAGTSPALVFATGTPDGNVHVAPFQLFMQTGRANGGGTYIASVDAQVDINILSTPANATNPRNDLIVAQQSDKFYADGSNAFQVRQVVGTPAGSPSDPTVTGSSDYVTLARVRVDANATTITSAKITDLRPTGPWTVALGGLLPVPSQAARDALSAYDGMAVYRQDRDWVEVMDGTAAWRVQGVAICTSAADLSAITSPYTGQVASQTDEGVLKRYTGSVWKRLTPYRVEQVLGSTAGSVVFSPIPTDLHRLRLTWTCRNNDAGFNVNILKLRINADAGNNYSYQFIQGANAAVTATPASAVAFYHAGLQPSATAAAGVFGAGDIEITGWDSPHTNTLSILSRSDTFDSGVTTSWFITGGGKYVPAGPYTSITLLPELGSFIAGSKFQLDGWA
jgi:hypothetical protein